MSVLVWFDNEYIIILAETQKLLTKKAGPVKIIQEVCPSSIENIPGIWKSDNNLKISWNVFAINAMTESTEQNQM